MINYTDLKFFDKLGNQIPLVYDSIFKVSIKNEYEDDALFYGVSDLNGMIESFYKVRSGGRFLYPTEEIDCSVNTVSGSFDVTAKVIMTKTESNISTDSKVEEGSISSIDTGHFNTMISGKVPFPSATFKARVTIPQVSTGLIETQSLFILVDGLDEYDTPVFEKVYSAGESIDEVTNKPVFTPVWPERFKLLFFIDCREQEDFRFFESDNDEITWKDRVIVDLNNPAGYRVNIGFSTDTEGVHEQTMYVCLLDTSVTSFPGDPGKVYPIGTIELEAEAIGEDERFRTLFSNFGIPDPLNFPSVFNNVDMNEDKVDYKLLNENSKKLFLAYTDIFPYVGTYKALVNAVKILGYNDVFFKEWYKELGKTTNTTNYITYDISYSSDLNANTINNLSIEERIRMKKLNWMSMVYKINEELVNEGYDSFGFPMTQKVYEYDSAEIVLKLISLKKWLEKYITGLNCRIIDVGGEGVYFERYRQDAYGSIQRLIQWDNVKNLTPKIANSPDDCELKDSSAYIKVNIGTLDASTSLEFLKEYAFYDFCEGYFDIESGIYHISEGAHDYYDSDETFRVYQGGTYDCFGVLHNYEIRANSKVTDFLFAGNFITPESPTLRIHDRKINFSPFDLVTKEKNTVFARLPIIQLERANIRSTKLNWTNSIRYSVSPDLRPDTKESYIIKNLQTGTRYASDEYITLVPPRHTETADEISLIPFSSDKKGMNVETITFKKFLDPDVTSDNEDGNVEILYRKNNINYGLKYSSLNDYSLAFFSIIGYQVLGMEKFVNYTEEMYLEILDGKMLFSDEENNRNIYVNFNFDDESSTQTIEVNLIYYSDEFHITHYNAIPGSSKETHFTDNKDYKSFVQNYLVNPESIIEYETVHSVKVLNSGEFVIDVYGKDTHNNIFSTRTNDNCYITMREPKLLIYSNTEFSNGMFSPRGIKLESVSKINDNYLNFCIYNPEPLVSDLKFTKEDGVTYVSYPSYSYSMHAPRDGEFLHFMNLTDKYNIVAIDKSFSNTSAEEFKGFSLILKRSGVKYFGKVVERSDTNLISTVSRQDTVYKLFDEVHNNESIKVFDVNVVFFSELSNTPVYQTYGWLTNGQAVNASKYKPDEYRLWINDDSDKAYAWTETEKTAESSIVYSIASSAIEHLKTIVPVDEVIVPDDDTIDEDVITTYKYLANDYSVGKLAELFKEIFYYYRIAGGETNPVTDTYGGKDLYDDLSTFANFNLDPAEIIVWVTNFKYTGYLLKNVSNVYHASRYYYMQGNPVNVRTQSEVELHARLTTDGGPLNMTNIITELLADTSYPYNAEYTTLKAKIDSLQPLATDDYMITAVSKSILDTLEKYGKTLNIYREERLDAYRHLYNYACKESNAFTVVDYDYGETRGTITSADEIKRDIQFYIKEQLNLFDTYASQIEVVTQESYATYYTKSVFLLYKYAIAKMLESIHVSTYNFTNENYNDIEYTLYDIFNITEVEDVMYGGLYMLVSTCTGAIQEMFVVNSTMYDALARSIESGTISNDFPIKTKLIKNLTLIATEMMTSPEVKWVTKQMKGVGHTYAVVHTGDKVGDKNDSSTGTSPNPGTDSSAGGSTPGTSSDKTLWYVKNYQWYFEGFQHVNQDKSSTIAPDVSELIEDKNIVTYIQPIWKLPVSIGLLGEFNKKIHINIPGDKNNYLYIEYADSTFVAKFRPGENIKLIFESIVDSTYLGQSAYKVIGYDIYNSILIVEGSINDSYIKQFNKELWAELKDWQRYEQSDLYKGSILISNANVFDPSKSNIEEGLITYKALDYVMPVKFDNETNKWYYKVQLFNGLGIYSPTSVAQQSDNVNIYISYAHNAFVDYELESCGSQENINGITKVCIKEDTNHVLKYIDDTFAILVNNFDIAEGITAWMDYSMTGDIALPAITTDKQSGIYEHENPIVLKENDSKYVTFDIVFDENFVDMDSIHVYWKVYKMSTIDNSRIFMFESYNRMIYLDYKDKGIYDIEAIVYDKFGNTVQRMYKGAYRIE